MLKYLLFCVLSAHALCAKPVPPVAEVPSHIVIVTPQAQVHLEPALKYDTPTAFIQHLSPLARLSAPHEETIVYVPASAAAPIIPIESVSVGRSGANVAAPQKAGAETKQYDQISQQIQQAIQSGSAMLAPQLSEAASMAAAAAASAGQGFFPAFFPPPSSSSTASSASTAERPKITYETPAGTEPLLPTNARLYAITPAVSRVVDFVHAPVFVGPISAIRARSIQEGEIPAVAAPAILLPEAQRPEALPLKEEPIAEEISKELPKPAEAEKKSDFGRFLEANTLKEEKNEQLPQLEKKDEIKELAPNAEPLATQLLQESNPQLKAVLTAVDANAVVAPVEAAKAPVAPVAPVGEEVVVVPQVKVA